MARKPEVNKVGLRATSGKRVLAFGLVRVGVGMAPLMEQDKRIGANLICPEHKEKVSRVWHCGHGHDVDNIEVEKAYPVGDAFVTLMEGEVPRPPGQDEIDLVSNVPDSDIPREYVEKSYLLWPDTAQDEGYALVLAYLRDNARAFVGTTTDSGTTKAFAVAYSDVTETLVAYLLNYEANVKWAAVEAVTGFMAGVPDPTDEMKGMAETVFSTIPSTFAWESVKDTYGEALAEAIATKAAGGTLSIASAPAAAAPVDLMAALKATVADSASVEQVKAKLPKGTHGRTKKQVAAEKGKVKA